VLDPIVTKDRDVDEVIKETHELMSAALKSIKTVSDSHRKLPIKE
jgi:hypothetical protein